MSSVDLLGFHAWWTPLVAVLLVFLIIFIMFVIKHLFFSGFGAHKLENPSNTQKQQGKKEEKAE